jgi:hypothetical protein
MNYQQVFTPCFPQARVLLTFPSQERKFSCALFAISLIILSAQLQRYLHEYFSDLPGQISHTTAIDFRVYYMAGLAARQHGRLYYPAQNANDLLLGAVPPDTPWDQMAKQQHFQNNYRFIYPPFAALLLEPITLVNPEVSLLLWRILNTSMLLAAILLILLLVGRDHLFLKFVLSFAAALSFCPFTETIFLGQIDPMILLAWAAGMYLSAADKPFWSALCFAFATMVKVSPAIVVPLFLLRKQWKWIFSYAGSMLMLLAISVWRLGFENHLLWFTQVLPYLSQGLAFFSNKSLAAFIFDLYLKNVPLAYNVQVPAYVLRLVKGLDALIYLGVLFYFWWKNKTATSLIHELAVLSLVMLIISPITWGHHYVLALVALIYLWMKSRETWRNLIILVLSTEVIGTVFLQYLMEKIRNPALDIAFASLVPVTSLLLLYVLLADYVPLSSTSQNMRAPEESLPQLQEQTAR